MTFTESTGRRRSGVPGYSKLTVPAYVYTYGIDRMFDQKQIDVAKGISSSSLPVTVGEFIDRYNVTASFGVAGSASYVVLERGHRPWWPERQ